MNALVKSEIYVKLVSYMAYSLLSFLGEKFKYSVIKNI